MNVIKNIYSEAKRHAYHNKKTNIYENFLKILIDEHFNVEEINQITKENFNDASDTEEG